MANKEKLFELKNNEQRLLFWQAAAMVSLLFMFISWLASIAAEGACNL